LHEGKGKKGKKKAGAPLLRKKKKAAFEIKVMPWQPVYYSRQGKKVHKGLQSTLYTKRRGSITNGTVVPRY
jgi:hypothetical protein